MILYSKWTSISLATRIKLAQEFGIAKVRSTHVTNNVVSDDGYNVKDIENAITIANLQGYIGSSSEDINELWELAIGKIDGKVPEVVQNTPEVIVEPVEAIVEVTPELVVKKQRVIKKTNAKVKKTSKK